MQNITALIMTHNGGATLSRVLQHLNENRIETVIIDHGSNDDVPAIIDHFWQAPVIERHHAKFDGVFDLTKQLDFKREIVSRLPGGWIIHLDDDEILEPENERETLRGFIEDHEGSEFSIIDANEFIFVPESESADYYGTDYVKTMRHYYRFGPVGQRFQRVFRKGVDLDAWAQSGGHKVSREDALTAPTRLRKRHYVGLSIDHLRSRYLGRVFARADIERGWHGNRIATGPDFIAPPHPDMLFHLDRDGWRDDNPLSEHLIFRSGKRAELKAPRKISENMTPTMPFIIGVSRSGSTLMRLMLDAHPDLAIPPETHWLVSLIRRLTSETVTLDEITDTLEASHNWQDMGVDDRELQALYSKVEAETPLQLVREIYAAYAKRQGATRYGDKTPPHSASILEIATALPEAHFIHMIRDGRDVAASLKGLWFGDGDDIRKVASMWVWRISRARQQAQFFDRYTEVRFEEFVRDPEAQLRRVCNAIDLEFDPAQLQAHERAQQRLAELADLRIRQDQVITAEQRQKIHAHTANPPDPSRIGRWRKSLSADEVAVFERIAGPTLKSLGYSLG